MFRKLIAQFWADESGAVIAAEYLMLGTIVAAGTTSGLVAMRDAVVSEYKDFGQSVRDLRHAHGVPMSQAKPTPTAVPYVPHRVGQPYEATLNPSYTFATP
jgi:Flp pilus assembly pilin Flp